MMDCKRVQENLCEKTGNRMLVDKQLSQSRWQQLHQQQLFLNETLNSSFLSSAQLFTSLQPNDSHIISETFMNQNFVNPSLKNDNNQSLSDDHGYSQFASTNQWLANKSDQFCYVLPNSVFNSSGENKVLTDRQDSFKKRKADNSPKAKTSKEDDGRTKRIKGETEATESNNNDQNNESNRSNRETSAETSKVTEAPSKPDYIHVRARRGQATDSHSLAERVRREKISERMKFLQELVPGCNRITGKAGMLDEIINYVQSLQKQVEFLSMKLATVNPSVDIDIDDLMSKEMYAICGGNFLGMGVSSELVNPTYVPYNQNQQQQLLGCCSLVSSAIPPQMVDGTSIVASLSGQESFKDSFQLHGNSSSWETDLQNYYNMELQQRKQSAPFPPVPFRCNNADAKDLKMEM